jgi:hypothetical protein
MQRRRPILIPTVQYHDELDELPQSFATWFDFGGGGEPQARIRRSLEYLRVGPGE